MEPVRRRWQAFTSSPAGRRFRDQYARRQRLMQGRWTIRRWANVAAGIALIAGGAVFAALPGPGWLLTVVGLGFLAREMAPVAAALDWGEVKARAFGRWMRDRWAHSQTARTLMILLGLTVVALLGVSLYAFIARGS